MSNASRFRTPLYVKLTVQRAVRRRWYHDATDEFLYALSVLSCGLYSYYIRSPPFRRFVNIYKHYHVATRAIRWLVASITVQLHRWWLFNDLQSTNTANCAPLFFSRVVIPHIRISSLSLFSTAAFHASLNRSVLFIKKKLTQIASFISICKKQSRQTKMIEYNK